MILEHKRKLASLYNTIKDLREAGKQSDQAYLDAFKEMQKTFKTVKELERQKDAQGETFVAEGKLAGNQDDAEMDQTPH